MINTRNALTLIAALVLSGCSSVDGEGRYRVATIGNAARAVKAVVVSAEPAFIQTNSGAGASAGGAMGGAIALENSDNAAVVIAGIIGGALVGGAIEKSLSKKNATKYVLEAATGALVVVAQIDAGKEIFKPGDKVVLVYGYPADLIRDRSESLKAREQAKEK